MLCHHGADAFVRINPSSRPYARHVCSLRSQAHASRQLSSTANSVAKTVQKTEGLIFPRGSSGSWDETAVGSPVVRCYVGDNEQRWYLWYSGRGPTAPAIDGVAAGSGSVGLAVSSDGVNWQRSSDKVAGDRGAAAAVDVGTVLEPNTDWWCFDTCHMSVGEVQVLSNSSVSGGVGVYWMFYSGGDFEPLSVPSSLPGLAPPGITLEGLRMRPGLAMSQDARNWARIEGEHHSGALFDVGAPGEWDHLYIGRPQVLAAGPRDMRLYYHSWDVSRQRFVLGLATSPDGFRWTKQGVIFDPAAESSKTPGAHDALGVAAHYVVRDPDTKQYVLLYEAVASDNKRTIGLAVSKDGRTGWRRYGKPVLQTAAAAGSSAVAATSAAVADDGQSEASTSNSSSAWDSGSVGAPCAVSMSGGRWRLYYGGRQDCSEGGWEGFGLALSVDDGQLFEGVPTTFRRRTGQA